MMSSLIIRRCLVLSLVLSVTHGFNNNQFFSSNDCCMLPSSSSTTNNNNNLNSINNPPQIFQPDIRVDDGVILIRNSRDVFPPLSNFYRNSNSYIAGNNLNNNNFGAVESTQNYNYGQYNQQQQQSSANINPFQNSFDANSWTQANANLFQQQSTFPQQQSSYPTQQQQGYGTPNNNNNNYGVQALTGYGGQPPVPSYLPPQQQQQNIQTYFPYNSGENINYPQQPQPLSSQEANIYSIQEPTNNNQGYVPPPPQQPEPQVYQPPQQPQPNYNSYPQPSFPPQEPEPSAQPTIDNTNLLQYAQYLEVLQKQYGIKLPSGGSSALPNIHEQQPQPQQQQQAAPNPYAAAVQPQTQSHIQSQLQPGLQGTYPLHQGENAWNPWQSNNPANNYNNFQQQISKPVVNTYVPPPPPPQPQVPIQQPQQQTYVNEVYQQPSPPPQQQPYYPGTSDFASSNAVVEPQPAPHIIFPQPQQPPRPQHVVAPPPQPEVVTFTRPQPPPPQPPKPQPIVYIPPTHPPTTHPPPTARTSLEYEREIAAVAARTTQSPPLRPSPATPSTTSIQALTQQIRRLPAVLYVDSRNPDTKRIETLLRETYGLPLVAFYIDKIDKPKTVERHLHQLTAHKGLPYLFICGTFIGSQQHIDNYHANRQIPQLVEFVCGDEKKRKHKKKASAAAAVTSAAAAASVAVI